MITSVTAVVLAVAAVLLLVSALIVVNRIVIGPNSLDRIVAADVLLAIMIAAIGLWTVQTHQSSEVIILLVLSLLGFTGAVAMARLVSDRVRTRRTFMERIAEQERP